MKYSFTALALAAIGSQVDAAVLRSQMDFVPNGWSEVSVASGKQAITLTVALQQQNEDSFYSKLNEISDPEHESYGQWLEKEHIDQILKPSATSKQAVISWLQKNGVKNIKSDDFHVSFATNVDTANKLLGATYKNFQQDGFTKTRTLSYSVPDELDQHIAVISPTTYLGSPTAGRVVFSPQWHSNVLSSAAADNCSQGLTPSCIKSYYNIKYTPSANTKSKMAFASFLNQSAFQSDLNLYEQKHGLKPEAFKSVTINGGVDNQNASNTNTGEANLDAQNMVAVGHPIPLTQFITGGSPPFIPNIDEPAGANTNEPWLNYLQYLLSKDNKDLPQVISHSYGDEEVTVPRDFAKKVCNGFAQLGARGITVLSSSGDIGVGAGCKTASNQTRFNAIFPASCPYVTAVGGTSVPRANLTLAYDNEGVWPGSSGGFSDFFEQPSFQKKAVETYLKQHAGNKVKDYAPYVNFTGRGFPDIAAIAGLPGYPIFDHGTESLSGGTSAASPVWGAIVALLNDARFKAGKKSMGFLNPFLYSVGQAGLRDITIRGSVGCNGVNYQSGQPIPGGGIVPNAFWNATVGWDPATGLGVPNFEKLKTAALSCKSSA